MTRNEHMDWCKQRATEYIDRNKLQDAFASMASDLQKHEGTAGHPGIQLGMNMLMAGHLKTAADMRRFIDGFN